MLRNRENGDNKGNKFWPGFSLGTVFASLALFLFGTKGGRRFLKRLIEAAEELEGSFDELLDEIEEISTEKIKTRQSSSASHKAEGHISGVMERIKSVLPVRREVKKYFVRDGKIVK